MMLPWDGAGERIAAPASQQLHMPTGNPPPTRDLKAKPAADSKRPGMAEGKSPGKPAAAQPSEKPPLLTAADFAARGACPLCGASGADAFVTVHDFVPIAVRSCARCGFMHSDKVMTEQGAKRYYAEVFGSEFHRKGQMINSEVNMRLLGKALPMDQLMTFLDVGCGYGYLDFELKSIGKRPMGVEVSRNESEYARERLGLEVRTGTLETVGMPTGWFDVAMCFEVVEHLARPVEFLRQMAGAIRPGGYVVIGTDNFESPVVQRMGARYPKWIPHTHVSHFGPQSLTDAMKRADLRVEAMWSYTPAENSLRSRLPKYKKTIEAKDAWNFEQHTKSEMARGMPGFWLRREVAKLWSAGVTLRKNDLGSMMFAIGRLRQ